MRRYWHPVCAAKYPGIKVNPVTPELAERILAERRAGKYLAQL
jgi:hypothetical protein